MEIKAEQLEKDIDAIPGVCEDGKKAIKKLFENNFKVKFEANLVCGGVYGDKDSPNLVINHQNRYAYLSLIGGAYKYPYIFTDCGSLSYSEVLGRIKGLKLLANSVEEYFRKKFDGKL